MKIDFSKVEIKKIKGDVLGKFPRVEFADIIYTKSSGVANSALAHKIFGKEEDDYSDAEVKLMRELLDSLGLVAAVSDALNNYLEE
jgi:hypothetical protein